MSTPGAARTRPLLPGFDPLRAAWALLTNVKFAVVLVGAALVASLLGVVIPQMPGPMRGNPAARDAWLQLQREDFGAVTTPMERLDLFEIFYSPWFNGLWVAILAAVAVCAVSRIRPTARSIHRPQREVPDRYFSTARFRADFSHPGGVDAVAGLLRRKWYRVRPTSTAPSPEGEVSYLFAERFSWSAYGTFLSHLALLLLLAGGLLTRFGGFQRVLALAEDAPGARVFSEPGAGQIFITMTDAVRGVDEQGNVVDFRSFIEIRRGEETVTCVTTVNDPCSAFGYRFHQAAFFDDLARLRISDAAGRPIFDDLLDFDNRAAVLPHLRISAGDRVLYDQPVPQMASDPGASAGPEDDLGLAVLALDNGQAVAVAWRADGDEGLALRASTAAGREVALAVPGASAQIDGLTLTYRGPAAVPAMRLDDLPGAPGPAVVQMPRDRKGQPYLFISGLGAAPVIVRPGEEVVVPGVTGELTYRFDGQVEGAGIDVRRDPGDTFIWVAVPLATVGLAMTFYVPRRRLWVKVTPDRTYLAGVGDRAAFGRELWRLGVALGAADVPGPEEDDER